MYGNYTYKALSDDEITETIYFGARNSSKVLYVNKDAAVNNEESNISKLNIYYKLGKITKIEWSYDFGIKMNYKMFIFFY